MPGGCWQPGRGAQHQQQHARRQRQDAEHLSVDDSSSEQVRARLAKAFDGRDRAQSKSEQRTPQRPAGAVANKRTSTCTERYESPGNRHLSVRRGGCVNGVHRHELHARGEHRGVD